MKEYFVRYKPFLFFFISFFGSYILLTLLYQFYLNGFGSNEVDTATRIVAQNSEKVISWFYQSIQAEQIVNEPFVRMRFQEQYIVRIVEGCNGISVIILFVSFIIAFKGNLKNTVLFISGGVLLIYVLNVLRIASLIVLIYYFPEEKKLLHNIFFPLIIYGLVFILWVIWVNKFSKYAK